MGGEGEEGEEESYCSVLYSHIDQDDVSATKVLPMNPLELRQNRHGHPGDAVQDAGGCLEVYVLDDQLLAKVGEKPRALATLRLSHQDRRRHLRVELGGAKRRSAGHGRVAARADPEVDGAYYGAFEFLDLSYDFRFRVFRKLLF